MPQVRIVLVETSHPGNIGGVARAMKNMGFYELVLVSPKSFPSGDATARAAGADDILAQARIVESLDQAIADCHMIIGTSARSRTIQWPQLNPRRCAQMLAAEPSSTKVALVFGRERSGLTNAELDRCQYWLHIPCNPSYRSLNLAAAVQVVTYELFLALNKTDSNPVLESPLATGEETEAFYGHLEQTLQMIGFLHPKKAPSLMRRLRRLFARIRLEKREVDILRGILTAAQQSKSKGIANED